jgi:hypothetical protein
MFYFWQAVEALFKVGFDILKIEILLSRTEISLLCISKKKTKNLWTKFFQAYYFSFLILYFNFNVFFFIKKTKIILKNISLRHNNIFRRQLGLRYFERKEFDR